MMCTDIKERRVDTGAAHKGQFSPLLGANII